MKTGKWNYTEDIEYKVVIVKLHAVPNTPMHWQNAFAGQERQAVHIIGPRKEVFLIDNQDGSGLLKVTNGGGPEFYHASIDEHEYIKDLPEDAWQAPDPNLFAENRRIAREYQRKADPEGFEKLELLLKKARATSFF